jgi:hypothetical protein
VLASLGAAPVAWSQGKPLETIRIASRPIADFIPVFVCIGEKICEKHGV